MESLYLHGIWLRSFNWIEYQISALRVEGSNPSVVTIVAIEAPIKGLFLFYGNFSITYLKYLAPYNALKCF